MYDLYVLFSSPSEKYVLGLVESFIVQLVRANIKGDTNLYYVVLFH